jgi:hypothetical protein
MQPISPDRPKAWPAAFSTLIFVIALTLGWIMTFDSTLLTTLTK